MTIRSRPLAVITAMILIAGIAVSMAFNLWRTESAKIPVRYSTGDFEGEYNPADIRGSYALGDIADNFDVTVAVLAEAFLVDDTDAPAEFQLKELEELYGELHDGGEIGTDAVRLFVARYLGLPYEAEETTRLPAPAVRLLEDRVSEVELAHLRTISVAAGVLRDSRPAETESETHAEDGEPAVKGRTTFDELIGWGFTKEEIEAILGIEMGPRSSTVRDYLVDHELEFSTYKVKLQELLDTKER